MSYDALNDQTRVGDSQHIIHRIVLASLTLLFPLLRVTYTYVELSESETQEKHVSWVQNTIKELRGHTHWAAKPYYKVR